ncbi:cryptochrome-1 isoform X2 [Frankliniella occidentalis]|uniref:Cryptochrome-1 isoform X2 n=1 Tax=Frankliniella occidentalis TaxID=133901 RepID=A0A9C6U6C1_FRAOC|nr:cryptochrome-1 isoform X2 [Frankliniella occidentalis]
MCSSESESEFITSPSAGSAATSIRPSPALSAATASAAAPRTKHSVHWFRKGLRLHDNPSLRHGLKGATTLRCIYFLDPWFAGSSNVGINKWRFLLQCLEDLDRSLRKFNSRLFVIRGQPADALPKLFKEWGTTNLTFEEDPEPFGRVRDQNIMAMCKELSISVVSKVSHTLYELEKIIEKNGGKPPLTYHQFQNVVASMDPPPQAMPTITSRNMQDCYTPIEDDHDEKYGVPTLEELGFDTEGLKPAVWLGGETEALARLEHHLERKAWVASFGRPKMTPQSLLASQTGLSPYLRFGCLSTRLFYYQLTDLYKKIKKAVPPLSLHGQLLWREFFYCAATRNPNFDKMQGNPVCVQIPWDHNLEAIAKWANGQTGFPWIDAIMTQLREEGWIHHLARHAVACFLTRGDLWISWEEGMKVFEELLLDADWSVNAGMWMWLSCSSFFQQFFHCYCPVRFGRKADPNGDYIRRYLPILKNFPTRYIHEPWSAPENVQRAAKCVVGKDYPKPMVNHGTASRINIERMKQVYTQLSKYRGSGLLATVPSSNMLFPSNNKSPSSPLERISTPTSTEQREQSREATTPENQHHCHLPQQQKQYLHQQHPFQQQQEKQNQEHSPEQEQHQPQLQQQHLPEQHLQHLSNQHHHSSQYQQNSGGLDVDSDADCHLMAPPKAQYQTAHAQQQQSSKMQISQQVLKTHQSSHIQPSNLQPAAHSHQMTPLHIQSPSMHSTNYQVQHHNLTHQMQSYRLDLQQDYTSENNQRSDQSQHRWSKKSRWQCNPEYKELDCGIASKTDAVGEDLIINNYNHIHKNDHKDDLT